MLEYRCNWRSEVTTVQPGTHTRSHTDSVKHTPTPTHTPERALDAGQHALDAGPRTLHAGPSALDAGSPRWAARWMLGRVDVGPCALDAGTHELDAGPRTLHVGPCALHAGVRALMQDPSRRMRGRARWTPGCALRWMLGSVRGMPVASGNRQWPSGPILLLQNGCIISFFIV